MNRRVRKTFGVGTAPRQSPRGNKTAGRRREEAQDHIVTEIVIGIVVMIEALPIMTDPGTNLCRHLSNTYT